MREFGGIWLEHHHGAPHTYTKDSLSFPRILQKYERLASYGTGREPSIAPACLTNFLPITIYILSQQQLDVLNAIMDQYTSPLVKITKVRYQPSPDQYNRRESCFIHIHLTYNGGTPQRFTKKNKLWFNSAILNNAINDFYANETQSFHAHSHPRMSRAARTAHNIRSINVLKQVTVDILKLVLTLFNY